ncbi:hypothetical protein N5I69_22645, partial [Klebsiella pneumoniae]|nr:hypothetical protein [Klebsiella pneumoniae]
IYSTKPVDGCKCQCGCQVISGAPECAIG